MKLTTKPIDVLLVEDDPTMQESLQRAINDEPELRLVGHAYTLVEAMQCLQTTQPDVVLVDLGLPDGSGLSLIEFIREHRPGCEAMVLTVFGDEAHVMASIEAGATGYLTKGSDRHDITDKLKQLKAGGSPISPTIARGLLNRFRDQLGPASPPGISAELGEAAAPANPLSEREHQVLTMVAKGFMQSEIADMLGVSNNTVSTYIKRVYKKLAVNSRTGAVHRASQMGLINLRRG